MKNARQMGVGGVIVAILIGIVAFWLIGEIIGFVLSLGFWLLIGAAVGAAVYIGYRKFQGMLSSGKRLT